MTAKELLILNARYRFEKQIDMYFASYELNIVKNTPEKIQKRLIEFYPEMKEFFLKLKELS